MPCATAASCFTSGCLLISPFLPFPWGGSPGAGFCPTDFFLAFFTSRPLCCQYFPLLHQCNATFVRTHWPFARAGFFFAGAVFTSEGAPACVFGAAFFGLAMRSRK